MRLFRKASEYLSPETKSISRILRNFATNIILLAFAGWVAFYASQNGIARFVLGLYVWGFSSLMVIVMIYVCNTKQTKPFESSIDYLIWVQSWSFILRFVYRVTYVSLDAAVIYCLIRLQTPMAAWFYGITHLAMVYLYFYPSLYSRTQARAKSLIPAGVEIDPAVINPIKF
jgi:hypothetical protein